MKRIFTFLLVSFVFNVSAVDIKVKCNGLEEVIISTDKGTDVLRGAYICTKAMPFPVVIIKNENYDDKLDMEDSISFYVGDDFTVYKEMLKKKFENFEKDMKDHFKYAGEKNAFFKIDFKDLYDDEEVEKMMTQAQSKVGLHKTANTKDEAEDEKDIFFKKRMYDPGNGRFLSEDKLPKTMADPNPYRYVYNNPISHTDPFGLDRRVCSRRLDYTPGQAGVFRHDFLQFKDSNGVISEKSFGGLGSKDGRNSSCGDWKKTSDSDDLKAKTYADALSSNMDYNLFQYNCQDFAQDVYKYK